ncbi:uncharacterized protein LOC114360465 [Ostrinia furnacalis]|uniref:uncharacterized protein LOC114360465 n=1 Tax=Ostrinia furnacalis TaxID=93504 RepID=UPI00103F333E|nr:uncharacterized protein LOC114360465 [Ostrinia furnacalis]
MFTSQCATCKDTVGHGPQCSVCKGNYHFNCAGISERGFSRLGSGRDSWICPACRDTNGSQLQDISPSPSASSTPLASQRLSSGLPIDRASSPRPVSPGQQSQDSILQDILAKVTSLEKRFIAFQTMESDVKQLKEDISDLKSSINTNIDGMSQRVSQIEDRLVPLEKVKSEMEELETVIRDLVESNSRNDQWVRRSNIQLNGIPYKNGENLISTVKRLAQLCDFPLNVDTDIDFVTRVALKNDVDNKSKTKPVILKLQSRYKKDDFLAALRKLKSIRASDLGFSGSESRVFANDHLSAKNKYLLQQAKMKAKEKNYLYCWVRNCTVMVRRNEKSPVIHITSDNDLKKIT